MPETMILSFYVCQSCFTYQLRFGTEIMFCDNCGNDVQEEFEFQKMYYPEEDHLTISWTQYWCQECDQIFWLETGEPVECPTCQETNNIVHMGEHSWSFGLSSTADFSSISNVTQIMYNTDKLLFKCEDCGRFIIWYSGSEEYPGKCSECEGDNLKNIINYKKHNLLEYVEVGEYGGET